MALLQALQLPSDAESCRRFCQEALQPAHPAHPATARHVGRAEQRQLYERLPWLMQRLHGWFALSNPGLEEAVLRTFHPQGPLSTLFAAMETPAFIFPLRKLPPRTLKTVLVASNTTNLRLNPSSRQMEDLSQSLLAVLGMDRLVRASGELEGLALTAQEFVLATLVYYLVAEAPPPSKPNSGSGNAGSSGGTGGSASTGGSNTGSSQSWSGSSSRQKQQGSLSSTYERLLLAHLQAYLPHRQYELARGQESRASAFLTRLFHEFLFEQRPQSSAARVLQCFSDVRLQPEALHSCRLVLLHIIANPCLRQGCEETGERLMFATPGRTAGRITRELSMLGPAVVQMLCELLRKLQSQKEVGLEAITSMTRMWLILLQPWKAPRLYAWYLSLRSPEPRLEPAPAARSTGPARPVDVALLGLEPEMVGSEVPVPQVPKDFVDDDRGLGVSASTRLAAAAGLTSAAVQLAASSAQSAQLVPGDGDPNSWRNYIGGFQGAYFLLEAILSTPLHAELCLELARHCAGWDRGPGLLANVGLTASRSTGSSWGNAAPTAQQLLRQRNAIQALKVLAQVLLCFSDPQLMQVLGSCPPQDLGVWLLEYGVALDLPMLPIFEDSLRPQLLMAVSVTWCALLAAASVAELQPLLAAVSRQLQHTQHWAGHFPALEETSKHKTFAETVLKEIGQVAKLPEAPAASSTSAVAAAVEFNGSEWQRPVRGGELEQLLCMAYWLANAIDRMLGRCPVMTPCGPVPQTEWPRVFGNWKFTLFLTMLLLLAVLC